MRRRVIHVLLLASLLSTVSWSYGDCVWVADGTAGTVSVINPDGGNQVSTVIQLAMGAIPTEVALSPSHPHIYVTDRGRASLWVIDSVNRVVLQEIPLRVAVPWGMAISPNGSKVYVGNADGGATAGQIDVVNANSLGETHLIDVSSQGLTPVDLAMAMDGTRLYIACAGTDNVLAYDFGTANLVTTGFPVALGGPSSRPYAIAVLPDDSAIYVADDDASGASSEVAVIDASTAALSKLSLLPGDRAVDVYASPTSPKVYVPTGPGGSVHVIDTGAKQFTYDMFYVPAGATPTRFAINLQGNEGAVTDPAHGWTLLFTSNSHDAVFTGVPTGSNPNGCAIASVVTGVSQSPRKAAVCGGLKAR